MKAAITMLLLLSSMGCGRSTRFDPNESMWVTIHGDSIPQGEHELCEDLDQVKSEIVSTKTPLNSKTRFLYVRRPKPESEWDKYIVLGRTIEPARDEDLEVLKSGLNVEVSEGGKTTWAFLRAKLMGRRIVQKVSELGCKEIYVPGQQEILDSYSGLVIVSDSNGDYMRFRAFVFRQGRIVDVKPPVLKEYF